MNGRYGEKGKTMAKRGRLPSRTSKKEILFPAGRDKEKGRCIFINSESIIYAIGLLLLKGIVYYNFKLVILTISKI